MPSHITVGTLKQNSLTYTQGLFTENAIFLTSDIDIHLVTAA